MDRTPPTEVRRALRQEVGFGCPVAGCRQAFLTWHHFDPPWNMEQHHRPEGMIALCRQHHDAADRGVYSCGDLRNLKQSLSNSHPAIANLPWSKQEFLIRLGGCYTGGTAVAIALAGERAVWLRRGDNGHLLLSFQLLAADGSILALMEDNMFEADPKRLYDLEASTGGTRLKFWLSRRNIGLELTFERVTMGELSNMLEADRLLASPPLELLHTADNQEVDPDSKPKSNSAWFQELPSFQRLPEALRDSILSKDPTGTFVKRWVSNHCLDDEQRVPLLNFEKLVFFRGSKRVEIRNGIVTEGLGIKYSAGFHSGVAAFNL